MSQEIYWEDPMLLPGEEHFAQDGEVIELPMRAYMQEPKRPLRTLSEDESRLDTALSSFESFLLLSLNRVCGQEDVNNLVVYYCKELRHRDLDQVLLAFDEREILGFPFDRIGVQSKEVVALIYVALLLRKSVQI